MALKTNLHEQLEDKVFIPRIAFFFCLALYSQTPLNIWSLMMIMLQIISLIIGLNQIKIMLFFVCKVL